MGVRAIFVPITPRRWPKDVDFTAWDISSGAWPEKRKGGAPGVRDSALSVFHRHLILRPIGLGLVVAPVPVTRDCGQAADD